MDGMGDFTELLMIIDLLFLKTIWFVINLILGSKSSPRSTHSSISGGNGSEGVTGLDGEVILEDFAYLYPISYENVIDL